MARKVLMIGIGSTGWQLCEQVLEKIELEWGSADSAPWIKLLAFETDQVEGGGLNRLGRGFRMTLGDKDITALKTTPAQFDETMNLSEWYDPQVVAQMSANSPGAGNIRQAAKIIFLFAKNATQFYTNVKNSLDSLGGLSEGTARAAALKSGLPNLDKFSLDSPTEILVFIAGSSAGGTGSGSLIEAGYFVRKIARDMGADVDIKGLVLLPPMTHMNVDHKANTFALLKELNHYQQTHVQWQGAFPIEGMERVIANIGEPPFADCFLGIPKPGAGQVDALGLLVENFAQFVYLSAVGSAANRLNAALINPKSLHAATEHIEGCPEAFHSIGIGVIEYPAAQVFKACTARLGVHLAEIWSKNSPSEEESVDVLTKGLGLGVSGGRDGLEPTSVGGMQQKIDMAVKTSNASTQLQMIANKVQQDAQAKPAGGGSARGAEPVLESKFQAFVKASLCDLDRGPKWLYGVLSRVDRTLDSKLDEAKDAEKRYRTASGRLTEALNHIREAESDPLVRFIPGWKKAAIQYWSRQFGSALADQQGGAGGLQIRSSVDDSRKALLGDPAMNRAGLIEQVLDRLGGEGHDNVSQWLQQFDLKCTESHDKIDASNFEINGIALFKPSFTVNSAYLDSIRTGWEAYSKGSVTGRNPEDSCTAALAIRFGELLAGDLLSSGKSRFDPSDSARPMNEDAPREIWSNADAQSLRTFTRPLFQGIFRHSVLKELWSNEAMAKDDLRNVRDSFAKPFISLNQNDLKKTTRTIGQDIAPHLDMVPEDSAELRAKTVTFLGGKDVTSEPWRLAVVRGDCMFSLVSIEGVRGDNSFEQWYDREKKGNEPSPGRHTHVTLPLVSLSGVPANFRERRRIDEGLFLCCLGIGMLSEDFTYTMREIFGFGQAQVRPFTHDIAAAGDLLMDGRLRVDMERAFDTFKSADTDGTELSKRMRAFIQRAGNYDLTYRGKAATSAKIADVIVSFARYKGFWDEIKSDAGIRQFVAEPLFISDPDDPRATPKISQMFMRPGLYCDNPNCGVMLVAQREIEDPHTGDKQPESETAMRDRLPNTCAKCGTMIKNA